MIQVTIAAMYSAYIRWFLVFHLKNEKTLLDHLNDHQNPLKKMQILWPKNCGFQLKTVVFNKIHGF